ncbi:hypothetical protein EGW08_004643 [Elysia chlorotica]|uniref:Uncharacterized protein n=1 Tax=Elysia chlorotica TaxID=188477 RepID=A0A3S1A0I6_ELYCH|nr:hypothetical protein EGW08_004643 [Elysia chlorotica]
MLFIASVCLNRVEGDFKQKSVPNILFSLSREFISLTLFYLSYVHRQRSFMASKSVKNRRISQVEFISHVCGYSCLEQVYLKFRDIFPVFFSTDNGNKNLMIYIYSVG